MKKKINKKIQKKISRKPKSRKANFLTLGNINPDHGRILILIICIIFVTTLMTIRQAAEKTELKVPALPAKQITKPTAFATNIAKMVQGYPIEQMTPYILKQDPKVAAFMIAIAKKESAWGVHHPVLGGEDCFNYWGFRLKSDRMGSGGHTCFDSPQEAVEIVGARLSHLVNDEKIDTPKEMVIWKCGYGCDGPEADGSQKWIKDVDYYYKQMIN